MRRKARAWSILLSAVVCAASGAHAQRYGAEGTLQWQGVAIKPGDVINFQGGAVTSATAHFLTYGHSALYLGVNPENGQPSFLDFTTTKGGAQAFAFGSAQPFSGRIIVEVEFLAANAEAHAGFDVYRLRGNPAIDEAAMFHEAKRIATNEEFGLSGEVCSTAVAAVLSKGTGRAVKGLSPDDLTRGPFQRHPQLAGKSLSIQAALRDARNRQMAGAWAGTVTQAVTKTQPEHAYVVEMRVDAAGSGTTRYPSQNCVGSLSGGAAADGTWSWRETITDGRFTPERRAGCIGGTITVRLVDSQTASWVWRGEWKGQRITTSGTLLRSK